MQKDEGETVREEGWGLHNAIQSNKYTIYRNITEIFTKYLTFSQKYPG